MKNHELFKNQLAVILFPETFEDAVDILYEKVPFLQMSCMRDLLVKKALFFTMFAVSISNEANWDIKSEEGVGVEMCISFEEEPSLEFGKEWEGEARRHTNYVYLDEMITGYARGLGLPKKKLRHRK